MTAIAPTRSIRSSTLTLADQICSSASNMLLLILVARSSSPAEFGRFATAFAIVTVWLGIMRASMAQVVLLEEGRGFAEVRRAAIALCTLAAGATYAVGVSVGLPMSFATLLTASVLLITVQDLGRYFCFATNAARTALASDAIWLVGLVAAIPLSTLTHMTSLGLATLWFLAGGIALLPLLRMRSPREALSQGQWRVMGSLGVEATLLLLVGQLGLFVLALSHGSSEVAKFRGAQVLLSPLVALAAALPALLTGPALRAGGGLSRLWRLSTVVAVAVTATCCAVVLALPSSIGEALLGDTWSAARPLVPLASLVQCLSMAVAVSLVFSRVRFGGRSSLLPRGAGAATEGVGAVVAGPSLGAAGVFSAAVAAQVVQLSLFAVRARRSHSEGSS